MLHSEYSDLVFLKGRLYSVIPTSPAKAVRMQWDSLVLMALGQALGVNH